MKVNITNLISEREAAELLGVSVALLRKQRYLGTGCPYVKLDRLVRYRTEDLEGYVLTHLKRGHSKTSFEEVRGENA